MTAIEAIGEGEFLTSVSKRLDVPYSTIVTWIDSDPDLSEMYSRARVQGYMKRMEDIEDDAQKLMDEVRTGAIPDPGPTIAAFKELRCIRQWNAGKFAKGLFGDKTQVEHSGSVKTEPDIDLSKFSGDDLATMRALLEKGKPVAPAND